MNEPILFASISAIVLLGSIQIAHLEMIKRNSAGFPILLKEWIHTTKLFDYQEIDKS
ncbi:MAG: hypothetical protein M3Y53_05345 [Thermoproteota archaeon]|nr:hypothetical protein [Thermoproteota archaeon]